MTRVAPRTPSGFPEYLPDEQIEFNRLLSIIRESYERYGFSPIDTPDLELSEVLLAKGGGETDQQIYRFEHGRNDLSMRFDLTVPLARYTAQHEGQLIFPYRRYHIGKVHRAERAQAGRFREFYQCDIDVIGSSSPIIDAEFPAIISEIFEQFNFGDITIRLSNRQILNGFFEGLGLVSESREVMRLVDKVEKISTAVLDVELAKTGLSSDQIDRLHSFISIEGTNNEILEQLEHLEVNSALYQDGLSKLSSLVASLRTIGVAESRFQIDLRIARGLDYYTGTVYETILDDYPELGSVCSGGRYDDLAGHYTSSTLPGVGISIGLSRLFYKLREARVIVPSKMSPADIVVMPLEERQIPQALLVAAMLRASGDATLLYTEPNDIKRKLKYADRMGFEWVVLIGASEMRDGTATIKHMALGESTTVPMEKVSDFIHQ
jgi:histidyl-tRNA synthetase